MVFGSQPMAEITGDRFVAYGDLKFHAELGALTISERALLDLIWRHGPISRKTLADISGVTGASATRLTKRALDLGLIEESIDRSGGVGNPARPLRRSQSGIYSAGIGFTKQSIRFALTDIEGAVLRVGSRSVDGITLDGLADFIEDMISSCDEINHREPKLIGIGLAIPGYRARTPNQWAVHWDFPDLQRVDVEAELGNRLGLPVTAERDAIAAAWAERLNGKGKTLSSYCLMYLAQGVGGAIMHDGRPLLGGHGNAGGLGILFPYDDGPRPSAHSLVEHLAGFGVDLSELNPGSKQHSVALDAWIDQVVPSLREGFNKIARLYDPEAIILGGSLPRFVLDRMVIATDYTGIRTNYTADLPAPRITVSELSEHSLLLGAASLPVARILTVS